MQVFPREVTDYIAREFEEYYDRKRERKKMSVRDAQILIDYVSGPVPPPVLPGAYDHTRPRVQGGGKRRPSSDTVQEMLGKYMTVNAKSGEWDEIFDELLKRHGKDKDVTRFVRLVFRDGVGEVGVCDDMHISRATYYKHRLAILSQAGLLAVKKELLNP